MVTEGGVDDGYGTTGTTPGEVDAILLGKTPAGLLLDVDNADELGNIGTAPLLPILVLDGVGVVLLRGFVPLSKVPAVVLAPGSSTDNAGQPCERLALWLGSELRDKET